MNEKTLSTQSIPTSIRAVVILQLCLAFSILLLHMAYPFSGEHFLAKKYSLLCNNLKTNPSLTSEDQLLIDACEKKINLQIERPFSDKLGESLSIVLFKLPSMERAWLFISIFISVLILLEVQGSRHTALLFPIIAVLFALSNYMEGKPLVLTEEEKLFPTIQYLKQHYVNDPNESEFESLKKAWPRYLITEWANETPSTNTEEFLEQLNKGSFAFNRARLHTFNPSIFQLSHMQFQSALNPIILILFVFWNCFTAVFVLLKK